jgi:hypothetical protein
MRTCESRGATGSTRPYSELITHGVNRDFTSQTFCRGSKPVTDVHVCVRERQTSHANLSRTTMKFSLALISSKAVKLTGFGGNSLRDQMAVRSSRLVEYRSKRCILNCFFVMKALVGNLKIRNGRNKKTYRPHLSPCPQELVAWISSIKRALLILRFAWPDAQNARAECSSCMTLRHEQGDTIGANTCLGVNALSAWRAMLFPNANTPPCDGGCRRKDMTVMNGTNISTTGALNEHR